MTAQAPLFTVERTFAGKVIVQNRPITVDDLTVSELEGAKPASIDDQYEAQHVVVLQRINLNEAIVKDLVEQFLSDNTNKMSVHALISKLMFTYKDADMKEIYADIIAIRSVVKYNGLSERKKRVEKYNTQLAKSLVQFEDQKSALLAVKVEEFNTLVNQCLNRFNEATSISARNILVKLNIRDEALDKVLSPEDKNELTQLSAKKDGIQAAIEALKTQINEIKEREYNVKKIAVCNNIEDSAGPEGMRLLEEYRNEGRPETELFDY